MDVRRWITGDGRQSISFPFMKILRLYEVIPFSRSLTLISSYEVTIEHRYGDTRCIAGGMVPASTIPTTIQSTSQSAIQTYGMNQLYARFSMPNTIPNQIPSYSYNADTAQALRD